MGNAAMTDTTTTTKPARTAIGAVIWSTIVAIIVAYLGYRLALPGWELVSLKGSPYYLLAGIGLLISGVLLLIRRPLGGTVFGVVSLATIAWALWESGLSFWPLLPRIFSPAVIGIVVLLGLLAFPKSKSRGLAMLTTGGATVVGLIIMGVALVGQYSIGQATSVSAQPAVAGTEPVSDAPDEWRYWGRDPGGTRYAPYDQITKDNIKNLKVAWQFRTGDIATGGSEDQNMPQQIGDTLYLCTPLNKVIALDPVTGKEKWRHDPQVRPGGWNRCRGLGYYDKTAARAAPVPAAATPAAATPAPPAAPATAPVAPAPAPATATATATICDKRIIGTTIDARLYALDAATGVRCPGFGTDGYVDLKVGQGDVRRGFYYQTSAPTVVRGVVVIGGWVQDNTELSEPSGVVRAFSAETGELVWAWDLGNPNITKLPPEGQSYTRGTPNVWSTAAFDDAMGLVFVPTGNATPDYWGSHRSPEMEKYASSVVALDATTGQPRWHFQTVHHDVWDWDVPSQPMLIDFPVNGRKVPAVVQLTKRGQIFVLDRATGAPLVPVTEKPVPQDPMPGEWLAPTQPYSAMPAITAETITEKLMWGHTPLDQLACRIEFHKLRYDGEFTPPGSAERPNLQYPGNGGGMNWGSGSYDPVNNRLLVNTVRSPIKVSLVPSNRPNMQLDRAPLRDPVKGAAAVPYQSRTPRFESDLGIPCLQPPYGVLTAIDLNTQKVLWSVPTGSARELGPNYGQWWERMKQRREEARNGGPQAKGPEPKAGAPAAPAPQAKGPEVKGPNASASAANANVESAQLPAPGRGGGAGGAGGAGGRGEAPKPIMSGLPIPIGTLGVGGSMTTKSGITFHAATQDKFLRAYDTATGKLIWEQKLPVGVGGTPMTYVKDGKQYLVVSAGGSRNQPDRGDYVIAFALP